MRARLRFQRSSIAPPLALKARWTERRSAVGKVRDWRGVIRELSAKGRGGSRSAIEGSSGLGGKQSRANRGG